MNKVNYFKIIYSVLAFFIWLQVYSALTTEYDENVAHILLSGIVWFISLIAIVVIAIKKREWIVSNKYFLLIYMLLTNPLTITFVMSFLRDEYGLYMAT